VLQVRKLAFAINKLTRKVRKVFNSLSLPNEYNPEMKISRSYWFISSAWARAREQAFVSQRTVIGGSVYGDRVLPGYYEIHCHNRDLAILPAFSRGDRRQKRGRGTSYADPSIQRSKDRRPKYEAFILLSAAIRTIHTLKPQPIEK